MNYLDPVFHWSVYWKVGHANWDSCKASSLEAAIVYADEIAREKGTSAYVFPRTVAAIDYCYGRDYAPVYEAAP